MTRWEEGKKTGLSSPEPLAKAICSGSMAIGKQLLVIVPRFADRNNLVVDGK